MSAAERKNYGESKTAAQIHNEIEAIRQRLISDPELDGSQQLELLDLYISHFSESNKSNDVLPNNWNC